MSLRLNEHTLLINQLVPQKTKTFRCRMPPCRGRRRSKHNGWGFYERTRGGLLGSQTWRRKICSFNPFQNTLQLKENPNHNILILLSLFLSKLIIFIMANVRTSVNPLNYLNETIPLDLTLMPK